MRLAFEYALGSPSGIVVDIVGRMMALSLLLLLSFVEDVVFDDN